MYACMAASVIERRQLNRQSEAAEASQKGGLQGLVLYLIGLEGLVLCLGGWKV